MQSWDAEKNQFSNFCELWEKAQSDQIFKNTPKPSDADYQLVKLKTGHRFMIEQIMSKQMIIRK